MKSLAITMAITLLAATPSTEIPPTALVQEGDERISVGTYECTAYPSTGNTCADGKYPCEGVTVASNDPDLWHKVIEINGTGTEWDGLYYVHDTGAMSNNVIDIFIDDRDECIEFGRRTAEIYVVDVGSATRKENE